MNGHRHRVSRLSALFVGLTLVAGCSDDGFGRQRYSVQGTVTYKGEKRISRFTYDDTTKTFVPGSEKVIFSYTTPVYNCCHNGAGMAFRDRPIRGPGGSGRRIRAFLSRKGPSGLRLPIYEGRLPDPSRPRDTGRRA